MGFTGLIIVIRKEIRTGLVRVQGVKAVLEGILLLVLFWGGAIVLLIENLNSVP
jgi:hypothetical protein